jgi:hypothetical protein
VRACVGGGWAGGGLVTSLLLLYVDTLDAFIRRRRVNDCTHRSTHARRHNTSDTVIPPHIRTQHTQMEMQARALSTHTHTHTHTCTHLRTHMHTMFVHQGAHLPHRMQRREHHPRHPLPDDALAPTRMSTLWASIVQDECHGWHGHTGGRAGGCVATQTHARDLAPGTPMVQYKNR